MKLVNLTVPRSMAGLAERLSGIMPTPSTRGRKGWCGCLQDDEPPEITYCVVDNSGTLSLQTMTPTLPMPEKSELDRLFAELVEELDLTAPNKTAMLELPAEKKWQIYCSKKKDQESTTDLSQSPEHYIQSIGTLSGDKDMNENINLFDSLKTALRTQPHSFVLRFVQADGLVTLLEVLSSMDYDTQQGTMHTSIIGCIKALMNNSTGRSHVLAHPSAISTIARSLITENPRTKVAVLEILGASCLVPGGHKKVLDAMTNYREYAHERARFQGVINDLDRNTGIYRDDLTVKTAIMSFINAVLSYGPGQESLEFRLHLRYEFLQLGLKNIINKLRELENQTLDRHMDFFEMVRNEDERELARKFEQEQVDTQSATSMFDLIRRKLSHSPAYPHFLSLLQHFLLLPLDYGSLPQHWLLFDRIVQQITLQTDSGTDNDVSPININVKEIVQQLAKEEELAAAKNKAEELEKENNNIAAILAKKEQELDLRNQEKEDMEASIARVKERLEKELSTHLETKQKLSELEDTTSELQHRIMYEQEERRKLETLLNNGSLPDDAKVNLGSSSLSVPIPPPPPPSMLKVRAPIPPPVPPPAPPLQFPTPNLPPPPGCLPPLVSRQRSVEIPKPTAPLKSFNWSKLPETKIAGTVWADIDEGKMYSSIDLETVDKLFCAYQNQKINGTVNEEVFEDPKQPVKNKAKILSVIDGRRAQNCTILLSKLKMSDEEIARVILDMDTKDIFPLDMVEQLLKFTPGPDEAALLEEHSYDLDSLARADRFLYEISKIAHYEQRLRSLVYKKKFVTWTGEVEGRAKVVMEASREVARSRRLRKLLELVLALGNYMNKGARGNAWGFRLSSLNRLSDTKSSSVRGTTLLHFIVDMADRKFKDVLLLEEDLPHVREASKVSLAELEKDMSQLRNNLKEVEREIEFQRVQPAVPGDNFLPAMKEFLTTATCRFSELEDLFQDMKTRFDRAVRLFGEDNSTIQPDDFFAIFDSFLTALNESRHDNITIKKRREEEEKRARQEGELKKLTLDRKHCKDVNGVIPNSSSGRRAGTQVSINGTSGERAEFDDLISALRTGDVFGEDSMAKIKRSRKSRHSPPTREHSRDRVLNVTRQK